MKTCPAQERILQLQQVRQEVVVRAQMLADGYSPWKDHEAAIHAVIAQKPAAAPLGSYERVRRATGSLMVLFGKGEIAGCTLISDCTKEG